MSRMLTRTSARVGQVRTQAGPLLIEAAQVALHRNGANARHPVQQRAHTCRSRWRGRRFRGIGIRRYAADGCRKTQWRRTAGDAAQLAAHAQAFVQLYRAVNAGDGVNRTDARARERLHSGDRAAGQTLSHYALRAGAAWTAPVQAVRFRARRLTGPTANTDRRVSNYKTVHRVILW